MLLKAAAVCLMSDVTQTFTDLGGWEGYGGLRRVPSILRSLGDWVESRRVVAANSVSGPTPSWRWNIC
jgi:hypothetical protein